VNELKGIRRVDACPECGNRAPHRLRYSWQKHSSWEDDYLGTVDMYTRYFVATCESCDELLLYGLISNGELGQRDFGKAGLWWPDIGLLDEKIPKAIRLHYNEALRLSQLSIDACVVEMRKALEAICRHQGVQGRNLAEGLNVLAAAGRLPPTLVDAAHQLRLVGNIGAHAKTIDLEQSDVRDVLDLARFIVDFLYAAPHRMRGLSDRIKRWAVHR